MLIQNHAINKAVVYSNPGTTATEIRQLGIPEPQEGQVLVKLSHSGVCHSDYSVCTSSWPSLPLSTPVGQVGGHEGVGRVVALGRNIPSDSPITLNCLVGIKWAASACLSCSLCLLGGETSCPSLQISGYFTPGTFQQYTLAPASYVTPIPEGVDPAEAAPLMCAGLTVYSALKKADIGRDGKGDWIAITGAGGGLGHLGIQYAKAMGARVIAIDSADKKAFCEGLGADVFVDFADSRFIGNQGEGGGLEGEVKRASGGGVRAVVACAANMSSYANALGMLGYRGKLICVGVPDGAERPIEGATISKFIGLEISILGSNAGNLADAKEALEYAAKGHIKVAYTLKKMEQLTEVFEDMHSGKLIGRVVLDLQ